MWSKFGTRLVTGKLELHPRAIHLCAENPLADPVKPTIEQEFLPGQATVQLKENFFRADPFAWAIPLEQPAKKFRSGLNLGNL